MKKKYMPLSEYCKEYMRYLGVAKTARRSYAESVRLLEARGFKDISTFKTLKPGDKVYRGYLDRPVMAAVIGKKPVAEVGLKVVGGHTDAPRLDLKPKPLYEKGPYVYFDCHIYGGIKKYQWLVRPLALYGTIVRKDGSKVNVAVGDDPKDPVFMISDILPHLGYDQAKKTRDEFFPAEDLDVIAWTTFAKPEKDAKKDAGPKADKNALVEFLKKTYKVDEEDLLSAELEIVPAGMPREVGFDRALIAGYGHDDRVCSFAGLQALLDACDEVPQQTASILMCDKEEIGSVGATGMTSSFFENTVAEIIERQEKNARDIMVRRALERSSMLSADVTATADPQRCGLPQGTGGLEVHGRHVEGRFERLRAGVRREDPQDHGRRRRHLADGRARQDGEGRRRHDRAVHVAVRHGRPGHGHAALEHARAVGTRGEGRLLEHVPRVLGLSEELSADRHFFNTDITPNGDMTHEHPS